MLNLSTRAVLAFIKLRELSGPASYSNVGRSDANDVDIFPSNPVYENRLKCLVKRVSRENFGSNGAYNFRYHPRRERRENAPSELGMESRV